MERLITRRGTGTKIEKMERYVNAGDIGEPTRIAYVFSKAEEVRRAIRPGDTGESVFLKNGEIVSPICATGEYRVDHYRPGEFTPTGEWRKDY